MRSTLLVISNRRSQKLRYETICGGQLIILHSGEDINWQASHLRLLRDYNNLLDEYQKIPSRHRVESDIYIYEEWSNEDAAFVEMCRVPVVVDKKRGHLVPTEAESAAAEAGKLISGGYVLTAQAQVNAPGEKRQVQRAQTPPVASGVPRKSGTSAAAPSASVLKRIH